MTGTRVTCEDVESGESDSVVIENNYILVTDGDCQLTNEQRYANGTVVLTIKRGPVMSTRCPDCGCVTPEPGDPDDRPGTPVILPGTRHRSTCPQVPQLTPEAQQKLQADLDEMDRVRRRAWAEARNFWIG